MVLIICIEKLQAQQNFLKSFVTHNFVEVMLGNRSFISAHQYSLVWAMDLIQFHGEKEGSGHGSFSDIRDRHKV